MTGGRVGKKSAKPKLAMYWGASCGGCEIALVNLHERILDVDAAFDFMFCPCLLDTKKKDIEALPDGAIAVTLFNGALRSSENEEMARLLRRKSRLLIATGSCAVEGCIPGLANLWSREELIEGVYLDSPTLDNPQGTLPAGSSATPLGALELPSLLPRVKTLREVVPVDYLIPGCPPESHQLWNALEAVILGELPSPGSFLGAGEGTVCRDCARTKEDKSIDRLYRNHEIEPVPGKCLLEQGLICLGVATRGGCGAPCPDANMPCSGCYGPPEGVADQGGAMIAALGSIIDPGEHRGKGEQELTLRLEAFLDQVPDYAGLLYKYTLPGSVLGGRVKR